MAMRELIKSTIAIDFMSKRYLCALLSLVAFAASLYLFISRGDAKYGTDFSGGHEFLVSFSGEFESDSIRKGLEGQGLSDVRVQRFQGAKNEYSIRLSEVGDVAAIRGRVETALRGAFSEAARIEKTDYVGPTVGAELRRSALLAVALATVGMLIYIAIRFEFAVGLGTIVALLHDVTIATGIYLLSGHVIGMATLAGALTIVGYSVNDTVVIFDRVREERRRRRSYTMKDVVNEALNFTLSRTVITHALTLFSALALYVIGTGEIKDLSLYLVAGIILGAYSTIFVVSPIVVWWEGRKLESSKIARAA
ncbi:MAG: protein translocase subunit SecF [Pseudomonadota bacterium]|jgi:preprotein translocase subunit SecF